MEFPKKQLQAFIDDPFIDEDEREFRTLEIAELSGPIYRDPVLEKKNIEGKQLQIEEEKEKSSNKRRKL